MNFSKLAEALSSDYLTLMFQVKNVFQLQLQEILGVVSSTAMYNNM